MAEHDDRVTVKLDANMVRVDGPPHRQTFAATGRPVCGDPEHRHHGACHVYRSSFELAYALKAQSTSEPYADVTKPGPAVVVTTEQFLRSPALIQHELHTLVRDRLSEFVFGPPWGRPDTWRGWPQRFTVTPRVDAAIAWTAEAVARLAGAVDVLRYGVPDPDDYR